jgi:hypothetical protein
VHVKRDVADAPDVIDVCSAARRGAQSTARAPGRMGCWWDARSLARRWMLACSELSHALVPARGTQALSPGPGCPS